MKISDYSTEELTRELIQRTGVESMKIVPYKNVCIQTGDQQFKFDGPAVVIVNID